MPRSAAQVAVSRATSGVDEERCTTVRPSKASARDGAQHLASGRVVAQADHHELRGPHRRGGVRSHGCTIGGERRRALWAAVPDGGGVARVEERAGQRGTHWAEPEDGDGGEGGGDRHVAILRLCLPILKYLLFGQVPTNR